MLHHLTDDEARMISRVLQSEQVMVVIAGRLDYMTLRCQWFNKVVLMLHSNPLCSAPPENLLNNLGAINAIFNGSLNFSISVVSCVSASSARSASSASSFVSNP